jgi:hypothetical protein
MQIQTFSLQGDGKQERSCDEEFHARMRSHGCARARGFRAPRQRGTALGPEEHTGRGVDYD